MRQQTKHTSQYLRGVISCNPSSPSELYRLMTGKAKTRKELRVGEIVSPNRSGSPEKDPAPLLKGVPPPESPRSALDLVEFHSPREPPAVEGSDSDDFFSYDDDDSYDDGDDIAKDFVHLRISKSRSIELPGLDQTPEEAEEGYRLLRRNLSDEIESFVNSMISDEEDRDVLPSDSSAEKDEDGLAGLAFLGEK